ncbi:TPA: site-specific integrase [Streptococcus suis]|nr:site-specific integrase [Streptococcus equi subsp. zooepidemicus]HEL0623328.1 site-specific integrase [Streptococcus equi subsp. zooepidemicus]HEL0674835.1 site-specific integrase [Streptococcus equi subsp. zooepidemicus]HEL1217525.1 site-specific integrase [Streptococcus equi subsp. zooepidemicus]
MATITKRGNSFRATVSLYKKGLYKRETKTFSNKKDAELWTLEMELEKGRGKNIAERSTLFTEFYHNWVNTVKKNDVREATFINYKRTLVVVDSLFDGIQLKHLDDLIMQKKIDHYAETHSRKTVKELVLKIRGSLKYAYARGLITNDFGHLLKAKGQEPPKRNIPLSITEFKKLRHHCLSHTEDEFNILVALALETGARRGELLGIKKEDIFEYGVKIQRSISPTNDDTQLKTKHSKRDISINKDIYQALNELAETKSDYVFDWNGFKQAGQLQKLLKQLELTKTTFHGLRDTHASFLFSKDISLDYISRRLGHNSILTTQQYYLELMPEKKHQQDADALSLLNDLSL